MKDPSFGTTTHSLTSGSDVILSSQFSPDEEPFAEYLWMEHEEEFNRQSLLIKNSSEDPKATVTDRGKPGSVFISSCVTEVLDQDLVEEELWEEEFIECCFQEMLEEEEQWEWFIPSRDLPATSVSQLQEQIGLLVLDVDVHPNADILDSVKSSILNPNAKEFTPGIQKHAM
uniref:Polyadenylate-binding protein-interacting protein 2 n=1 Tax=Oryzias latipes TaxID=8090 RepID=A0A3B3IG76_ORYLA